MLYVKVVGKVSVSIIPVSALDKQELHKFWELGYKVYGFINSSKER